MNEEIEALKQQLHTEREAHQKEIALVREDAQIDLLNKDKKLADIVFKMDSRIEELEIINKEHQKINGELRAEYNALTKANQNLREKIEQYQDKAAHYRRKGVL